MRLLISLLVVLSISGCSSIYFSVLSASQQKIVGGRPETGSQIEYRFQILVEQSVVAKFDSLWIGERGLALKYSYPHWDKEGAVEKGDTIHLVATAAYKASEGDVFLKYRMGDIAEILRVDSVQRLEAVYLP